MLNPFPDLLTFAILAPVLVRVTVGAFFFYLAVRHYKARNEVTAALSPLVGPLSKSAGLILALLELLVGISLVVGAWVQVAALVAGVMCLKFLMIRSRLTALVPFARTTNLLLLVMCLTLLVTGGGIFGFDIPML